MSKAPADQLVVAISSRCPVRLRAGKPVVRGQRRPRLTWHCQQQKLAEPAPPGVAFSLVRKLLAFNADGQRRVEVVVLSAQ